MEGTKGSSRLSSAAVPTLPWLQLGSKFGLSIQVETAEANSDRVAAVAVALTVTAAPAAAGAGAASANDPGASPSALACDDSAATSLFEPPPQALISVATASRVLARRKFVIELGFMIRLFSMGMFNIMSSHLVEGWWVRDSLLPIVSRGNTQLPNRPEIRGDALQPRSNSRRCSCPPAEPLLSAA